WVARARRGTEVLVTDRGAPVARLVPVRGVDPLEALIEAGVIEPAPKGVRRRQPSTRVHLHGDGPSMADYVARQRR
ncbi:MAG: type II toxin-antitoxin system prevent-host-death family antitoxin, partial [Deltaproteobacteria bacterium]